MNRRRFLRDVLSASGALAIDSAHGFPLASQTSRAIPVIDSHIHLFDPTRPGGIPWPKPDDPIYKPALPTRYEAIASAFGVVGAIAIEASPLAKDNDWVLATIAANPVMVGMIGDLAPHDPGFQQSLDRLRSNPLFLGIRYGNLWNRNLAVDKNKPGFMDGLKSLADHGLVFESANPTPALVAALLDISQALPDLTIVIDHLPQLELPATGPARDACQAHIAELGKSPKVFAKISEVPHLVGGKLETSPAYYADKLDMFWDAFGPNHLLFGSDWPNSDHVAGYADTFKIVHNYVAAKGGKAMESYYWRNSIAAYRWKPRRANQYLHAS